LSEPPSDADRPGLLFLLGTAEWRAGQPGAIVHLEHALAAAGDDPRMLLAAGGLLGFAHYVSDRAEGAVEVLERVLAGIGGVGAGIPLTVEASIAVVGMLNDRTAPSALRRAERLRGRLNELADPPVYLLVMLAYDSARANRAAEAQALAERALACEPYPPPLDICTLLIVTLTLIECYDPLQRLCEDLLAAARRGGAMQEAVGISVFRAWGSIDRGALADAEADARWVLERAEGIRQMHAACEVIRVLIEHDELQAAEDVLEQCADPCASGSVEAARLLIARGQLRAAEGRPQEALHDLGFVGK
jgi:hypothetical protein